jgi:hypothetical protein
MEGSLVAYKVFTNGSVLNASEINDNLMNQSVMVFSNSTARAAALTAPVEGMLTWLQDVNRYEYRNGANAWVTLGSGVLQVVSTVKTDTFSASTSNTWADITGLSVSITPSSSSSKVLVVSAIHGSATTNGVANIQLIRGSTAIAIGDAAGSRPQSSSSIDSNGGEPIMSSSITFLDSPATTSATTYKLALNTGDNTGTAYINRTSADANNIYSGRYASTITVMEISG